MPLTLLKGLCVWGSWRLNRTATYWPPLLWPQRRFFPVLLGCSTGGLGAQPFWVLVFSTASYHQLMELPVHRVIILFNYNFLLVGVTNRTHSTRPRSRLYSNIPWPDAPVIYTIFWSPAGSEVNIKHYDYHIYQTPPLRQDMTQGQFLSGV